MNLLPEGVTATAEELVNSVKGHLDIIDDLENRGFDGLNDIETRDYCCTLRQQVYEAYIKTFKFKSEPPKPATEANLQSQQ